MADRRLSLQVVPINPLLWWVATKRRTNLALTKIGTEGKKGGMDLGTERGMGKE